MSALGDLIGQFPPPDRAVWLALVDKTLKGRALPGHPLYTQGDAAPVALARGVLDRYQPWDIRAVVAQSDPMAANAQALEDLDGGAASVLLRVGPEGLAPTDLATALDGVMLELATAALDAGFWGPNAAEALGDAAKRSPRALLALHLDPLGAFAEVGVSPGPLEAHLDKAAHVAVRLAHAYPLASLFLANGRAVHEAGGSDTQELAMMAAAAVAYVRALEAQGLTLPDAFARLTLGVSIDGDLAAGLAKLRAARLVWAQVTAACGLTDLPARIEVRSSQRMLSKMDAWTNLLRLTAAAAAAAMGGADAVVLDPFSQPLGPADDLARRQARNIQLVLMEEAGLGRVQDPARGSWFFDAAAQGLAAQAWAAFQVIEAEGGLAAALKGGVVARAVQDQRAAYQARVDRGDVRLVGVNLHPDAQAGPPAVAEPPLARSASDARLAGPDDVCPALSPIRWAEPFEAGAGR